MKRYLLFAGEDYYPLGGMNDLQDSYDTLEEAVEAQNSTVYRDEWGHIYDLEENEVVMTFWRGQSRDGDWTNAEWWHWEQDEKEARENIAEIEALARKPAE